MAVAVKNPTTVGSARSFDRLPLVSLVGVAYVVACLVIIFGLIPVAWSRVWAFGDSYAGAVLLGVVLLAATIGSCVLGSRLLGTDAPPGARAGILFGLIGLSLALLLTRWGSSWAEYFTDNNFAGGASETVGLAITAVLGALSVVAVLLYLFNFNLNKLISKRSGQDQLPSQRVYVTCLSTAVAGLAGFLFIRYGPNFGSGIEKLFYQFCSVTLILIAGVVALVVYSAPAAHRHMIEVESQGWLSTRSYKPLQGVRVRRGTLIGLLILAGTGIYTLLNHNILPGGNWQVSVPFTAKVIVINDGDVGSQLDERFPDRPRGPDAKLVLDRRTLQQINEKATSGKYVKIDNVDPVGAWTRFKTGDVTTVDDYKAEIKQLKADNRANPDDTPDKIISTVPLARASGPEQYQMLTLLPNVRYTLGMLLLPLLGLWLAWRINNVPSFADFQIATEAEMNKVSWTTKKRLYQDTIVVLVTVFLMAVYLFAIDQVWDHLLSWKRVGVIVFKPSDAEAEKHADEKSY